MPIPPLSPQAAAWTAHRRGRVRTANPPAPPPRRSAWPGSRRALPTQGIDQRHRPSQVRFPNQAHGGAVGQADLRAPGSATPHGGCQPHLLEGWRRCLRCPPARCLINPVVPLPGPQTVSSGELCQAQTAVSILGHPPRTLRAAVPCQSVAIALHAPTVAPPQAPRTDAPRLPLTFCFPPRARGARWVTVALPQQGGAAVRRGAFLAHQPIELAGGGRGNEHRISGHTRHRGPRRMRQIAGALESECAPGSRPGED